MTPSSPTEPSPEDLPRLNVEALTKALNRAEHGNDPRAYDDAWNDAPIELRRRRLLPAVLFLATCASTFFVGVTSWQPLSYLETAGQAGMLSQVIWHQWEQGFAYMAAVLSILLTHEMGHFLLTVRYGIASSYPIFIPIPFNAVGTLGAVISMDGLKANRREMFDIGIAGPLAGLAVTLPVLWLGILRLQVAGIPNGGITFHNPLIVQWMIRYLRPDIAAQVPSLDVGVAHLNAYFMAGWVGLLITGLNMLPISQLDGGHVAYALFGRRAHMVARAFILLAIAFVIIYEVYLWTMMIVLVVLIGADHPPTANDAVPLGKFRWLLGLGSLVIPVVCFPLFGVSIP